MTEIDIDGFKCRKASTPVARLVEMSTLSPAFETAKGNTKKTNRVLSVGAALGAILLRHSVSVTLALAAATSSLCSVALLASIFWNSRTVVSKFPV